MLNSVISIEDFVGNEIETVKLVSWLNEFYHERRETTKKYAIVYGETGNGKTILSYALANSFEVPILSTTPLDLLTKEDINWFKKSLNTFTYDASSENKLILIDDIEDYNQYIKIQLMSNVVKLSDQPIIFTTSDIYKLPEKFKENAILCRIKKPLHGELEKLLVKLNKEYGFGLTKEQLKIISSKATSVRSAINSLFSPDSAELEDYEPSIFEKFKQIKQGWLKEPLDYYSLQILTYNCKDIEDAVYMDKLVIRAGTNNFIDTHHLLLNCKDLKLPGRYDFIRTTIEDRKLNEEELKLIKKLHISSRVYRNSYKFLRQVEEVKKKDSVKSMSKIEFKKQNIQSLSSFY